LGAKQFLEIEVVQQWESTFEGVTDLAWSDSDDAELAVLRAEVERLRAAAQPALPSGRAPRGRPVDRPAGGRLLDPGEGPDFDRQRGDRERLRRNRVRQAREAG
jgi:hypothetical protein